MYYASTIRKYYLNKVLDLVGELVNVGWYHAWEEINNIQIQHISDYVIINTPINLVCTLPQSNGISMYHFSINPQENYH